MDILLNEFKHFSLWLLSKKSLSELSKFIIYVNNKVHLKTDMVSYPELIKTRKYDLENYANSFFYAIKNSSNEIVGTIKAQKWDGINRLPIEEDFGIEVSNFLETLERKPKEVWHIGRLAIDQEKIKTDRYLRQNRITILKLLLTISLQHITSNSTNIFIAESDKKLFDKLKLLGINSLKLGASKYYLGSETVPIYNNAQGVIKFVDDHKHLLQTTSLRPLFSA